MFAAVCASIAERIGSGIARLHNAGIVHGDLTTSNMIVRSVPSCGGNDCEGVGGLTSAPHESAASGSVQSRRASSASSLSVVR